MRAAWRFSACTRHGTGYQGKGHTHKTGVTKGGLGAAFSLSIASAQPSLLILAGRDLARIKETASEIAASSKTGHSIPIRHLTLDLASLAAVRTAAAAVDSWDDVPHIDVLVNNAGVHPLRYVQSVDGFEANLATNHLGPFLFTNLIMRKLIAARQPARIVTIASDAHRLHPFRFGDYNFSSGNTFDRWPAYAQSKTANMLFTVSLAEKLGEKHGLLAFSLEPGVVGTNMMDKVLEEESDPVVSLRAADRVMGNVEGWSTKPLYVKTPDEGAATYVYAAFDQGLSAYNGAYLLDCSVADPWKTTVKPWATDKVEAEKLWQLSERLVGQTFSY
ncbi:hypothetical protein M426DRAFT_322580 [Hypoxylon sp. CI-4A]|nr:hypothetical protein M426DRAFT_322580 [Hypoxylon sp. CI-4A]